MAGNVDSVVLEEIRVKSRQDRKGTCKTLYFGRDLSFNNMGCCHSRNSWKETRFYNLLKKGAS